MTRITTLACVVVCICTLHFCAYAWKKEAHFISLPLIEGSGIYTSIRLLQDSHSSNTKAAAGVNISLLATEAGIGCFSIFGPQENYPLLRRIHRITGFIVTAGALWMSISAGSDSHIQNQDKNISYGYTALTCVPLVVFSF